MLIFMLAAAMTVAMLIATVFGLHQEADRVRASTSKNATSLTPFWARIRSAPVLDQLS